MSHQLLQLFLPSILVFSQLKMQVWQPYNFISFGSTSPQWELEQRLINQTHPLTHHLLCSVQLSAVSKRTTLFEHHNLRTLSTWKIVLILLKWQWNFADWKLHGTWIIYSVPEAILVSMWICCLITSSSSLRVKSSKFRVVIVLMLPWELWFLTLKLCIDQSGQHQLGIFTCGTTNYGRHSGSRSMTEVKE